MRGLYCLRRSFAMPFFVVESSQMHWIWQGITTDILSALVISSFGLLVAWARHKNWKWVTSLLYGLGACVLLGGIMLMSRTWSMLPAVVTTESVEGDVRRWLDNFGLSVAKDDDTTAFFALQARLPNGGGSTIRRLKKHPDYLVLNRRLTVSPEHANILANQSKEFQIRLASDVAIELSRLRANNMMVMKTGEGAELTGIVFSKRLPIDSKLTEALFMEALDDIEFVSGVAALTIQSRLSSVK